MNWQNCFACFDERRSILLNAQNFKSEGKMLKRSAAIVGSFTLLLSVCFISRSEIAFAQQKSPVKTIKCPSIAPCDTDAEYQTTMRACINVANFATAYGHKIDYDSSECTQIADRMVIKDQSYWFMMVANPPRLFVTRPNILSTGDCYYYPKPEARRQIRDYECLN